MSLYTHNQTYLAVICGISYINYNLHTHLQIYTVHKLSFYILQKLQFKNCGAKYDSKTQYLV